MYKNLLVAVDHSEITERVLGAAPGDDAVAQAEELGLQLGIAHRPLQAAQGVRHVKLHLGHGVEADLATVDAVRAAGPDLQIAVDAHWAFARLRPQARRPQLDRCPTTMPRVRVVSLVCTYDRVISPAWSRQVARERLGVEPIELPTGHFPMIASPRLLAEALVACAA